MTHPAADDVLRPEVDGPILRIGVDRPDANDLCDLAVVAIRVARAAEGVAAFLECRAPVLRGV